MKKDRVRCEREARTDMGELKGRVWSEEKDDVEWCIRVFGEICGTWSGTLETCTRENGRQPGAWTD